MKHIQLSSRSVRDLQRLRSGPDARRMRRALEQGLAAEPQPANLDIKALEGAAPWLRMRVGDQRIIYRALHREEMDELAEAAKAAGNEIEANEGYLVERVINRRDLERVVESLPRA